MGTVDDFIEKIKQNEGYRFDKQVAEIIGVDKASLANAKVRNKLPNSYVMWYCEKYNVTLKEFKKDILKTNNKQKDSKMYEFALELAQDKIVIQQEEINKLRTIIDKKTKQNQPLWNDIQFDVRTTQTYNDNDYSTFQTYEMKYYQDFYRILGYSKVEAEKLWKIQHDWFTGKGDYTSDSYLDETILGYKINSEKTDNHITDDNETERHFKYNLDCQVVSQLQIYNACYIKKNGEEIMAILSVLFNFLNRSSQTKIKFLTS